MSESSRARSSLPTGSVAILFTDIEGSTALWEQDGARMSQALAAHDTLARTAVESRRGTVVKMTGDGMYAVFDDARDALATAVALQQALADPAATGGVGLRARCGLHAGIVERRDNDCFGSAVNRTARIMSAAHGGQILVSRAVADGVGDLLAGPVSLRDLGRVRLKDLSTPEHVFQVVHPDLRQEFPALRSLESTPNNLPQQVTRFIGRERELAELQPLLAGSRLLTLIGSGGCGKTRLGLQVAAAALEQFPDGVWLVELAAIADAALVPHAVAAALGVGEVRGRAIGQVLVDHLDDKRLLLVVDNCEHLLDACASLADTLLRQCPGVQILASSREALGIAGEQGYRVPSLARPDPRQAPSPEAVARFEAVQLFTDRALLARSDFRITRQNAAALASICQRLDGIPLAIELAAARVRSMAVEEIDARLDQRFSLLTGGSRTALPRQQTLRSLIDWSYDLLNGPEQALLCRLAVFSGGWTLGAAEQVCAEDGVDATAVLDLHASLAGKSLLLTDERHGATRYRMLETVRQYARDRLLDGGAVGRWRDRHLAHFLALAETAEPKLVGAEQKAWLDRLDAEHDNLRTALAWSTGAGGDRCSGLRLAGALFRFWFVRGHLDEGRNWLGEVLDGAPHDQDATARAKALNGAAIVAMQQGDLAAARALHEECLAIRRGLGDRLGIANSLANLGVMTYDLGDYETTQRLYAESLAIRREFGDPWGVATQLNNMGNVAYEMGDFSAAREMHSESLRVRRQLGDLGGAAASQLNLGLLAFEEGDAVAARALYEESLALRRELGDRRGTASSLSNLGDLAFAEGEVAAARALYAESLAIVRELGDRRGIAALLDGYAAFSVSSPDRATQLWAAAARLREAIGAAQALRDRARAQPMVEAARAALGEPGFRRAWQQGRALTLEQAVELALDDPEARS